MELRPYQRQAIDAVAGCLDTRADNPCVVIPTGGGKTLVIAELCARAAAEGRRVVVLAHVRELLEQAAAEMRSLAPGVPLGVYSAGLGRRDLGYAVTIAGIQSVHRRAEGLGPIDLVIVDEAHLIPPEGEGMYRRFLAAAKEMNPKARVVGFTATAFRLGSGAICGPDNILNHVCYEATVRELIVHGYLSPLRARAGRDKADTGGLHVRGGEFVTGEAEDLMDAEALVESACGEIVEQTADRRATLVFASGVRHGGHIVGALERGHGVECGFVTGETPDGERDGLLRRFRAGDLRYLCNVNVLTTGFDAPHTDCVALLRPTASPGLYYQMVGRGFRRHPGKADCLVLDFGGNVVRHGPVDAIRVRGPGAGGGRPPAKECPACRALIAAGYQRCPECGHDFPEAERARHAATAGTEGILSGQVSREERRVIETAYHTHRKVSDEDAPPTMRVEYRVGFMGHLSEWVCFEHAGYARSRAAAWWRARSVEPVPPSVEEAVDLARAGALAPTLLITVERKAGEKYERVVGHTLGDKPPRLDDPDAAPAYEPQLASADDGFPDEEVPF